MDAHHDFTFNRKLAATEMSADPAKLEREYARHPPDLGNNASIGELRVYRDARLLNMIVTEVPQIVNNALAATGIRSR